MKNIFTAFVKESNILGMNIENLMWNMKRLIVLVLLVNFLFACSDDRNNDNQTTAPEPTQAQRAVDPPQPIQNTREAQLLLRDYWVFEYFIVPGNREESVANRGKWYKFNGDGTFTAGHWQDFQTTGTWTLHYGGEFPIIHVQAQNTALTGEYQIQGISNDTEYMSWMGTARYNQKGNAVKVMNLLTEPTREQFSVQ